MSILWSLGGAFREFVSWRVRFLVGLFSIGDNEQSKTQSTVSHFHLKGEHLWNPALSQGTRLDLHMQASGKSSELQARMPQEQRDLALFDIKAHFNWTWNHLCSGNIHNIPIGSRGPQKKTKTDATQPIKNPIKMSCLLTLCVTENGFGNIHNCIEITVKPPNVNATEVMWIRIGPTFLALNHTRTFNLTCGDFFGIRRKMSMYLTRAHFS